MNQKYLVVPDIISSKDLDYLSDMFQWNYAAYKNTLDSINHTTDQEIIQMLNKGSLLFHKAMSNILTILESGENYE